MTSLTDASLAEPSLAGGAALPGGSARPADRVSGSEACSGRVEAGHDGSLALSDGTRIRFSRLTGEHVLEPT